MPESSMEKVPPAPGKCASCCRMMCCWAVMIMRPHRTSSTLLKEGAEELRAFEGEHALDDFDTVIQKIGIGDAEFAPDASEANVASAEHKTGDAGGYDGSGTHDAWLDSRIEGCALKPVIGNSLCGLTNGRDFSM